MAVHHSHPDGIAADADKTTYAYTPAGQVATVADNNGNTWTYAYNLLGEKVSSTDPGTVGSSGPSGQAGTTSYAYDPGGNLTSTTSHPGRSSATPMTRWAARQRSTAARWLAAPRSRSWTYDQPPLSPQHHRQDPRATVLVDRDPHRIDAGPPTPSQSLATTAHMRRPASRETVPSSALVPGATGTSSYRTTSTYTTLTGEPATTVYNGDNGLPAGDGQLLV